MKLILYVLTLGIMLLVKIGDAVLAIPRLFVWLIKQIFTIMFMALWFFPQLLIDNITRLAQQTITIIFSPFTKMFSARRKQKPITRKIKRIKPSAFFPLPFMVKFKYFLIGGVFSLMFIFLPSLIFVFLQELPNPRSIWVGHIPQTSKIYDRNGNLLYQIYAAQNRTLVTLDTISKYLQYATIAIEDKDFYRHPGFDLAAIIRSLVENLSGNSLQGGSTITQQLIKSALLTPETSIQRKIKEVILAFWTERLYTKDQILEMYFNQIPYGGTAWGVEAASQTYFNKSVKDLDLAESAFLAGMPRAPSVYSPFGENPEIWKKRQREVLHRMKNLGYITESQAREAEEEELFFQPPQTPLYAPHFVMYVKDLLVKKYGLPMVEKGGLTVVTSLDLKTQEMAQKIVRDEVNSNAHLNLTNGAAVVTNPKNGDILAMVGSKDFSDPDGGNFNVATSLRQPGSTVKAITYSAALSNGFTAATILDDSPVVFKLANGFIYSPVNYDGRSHGRMPLRLAFANSFNITAVRTLNQIGVSTFVNLGKRMGIKNWSDPNKYGLSITLGSAEVTMMDMANVYGVLANGGIKVGTNPIIKLTDYKGNVLEEKLSQSSISSNGQLNFNERILDEGVAFIISDILADNHARALEFGTNSPLRIPGHTVSVKTGTSDNKRDNWTIGYTPNTLVVSWVGNNNNAPMSQNLASGITGAAPIWNKIMENLLKDSPNVTIAIPSNVIKKVCLNRIEYFVKGTENSASCSSYSYPTPLPSVSSTPTP